jgi:hypothetical protein
MEQTVNSLDSGWHVAANLGKRLMSKNSQRCLLQQCRFAYAERRSPSNEHEWRLKYMEDGGGVKFEKKYDGRDQGLPNAGTDVRSVC